MEQFNRRKNTNTLPGILHSKKPSHSTESLQKDALKIVIPEQKVLYQEKGTESAKSTKNLNFLTPHNSMKSSFALVEDMKSSLN
jgi:hypothetical protein